MKSDSCKKKGARLQNEIRAALLEYGFNEADVLSRPMGNAGVDICLAQAVRDVLPLAIESKYTEHLEVWAAIKQAEANAKTEGLLPCVVFRRNRSETYAILRFDDLLRLLLPDRQRAEGAKQTAAEGGQTAEGINSNNTKG